jgi:hypothetical protein
MAGMSGQIQSMRWIEEMYPCFFFADYNVDDYEYVFLETGERLAEHL